MGYIPHIVVVSLLLIFIIKFSFFLLNAKTRLKMNEHDAHIYFVVFLIMINA